MITKNKTANKGFTLIELLVVVAIIALLSSVVLGSLAVARQKGRDTKRISDIRQIRNALQLYFNANKSYPQALSSLAPTYISAVPVDPVGLSAGVACRATGGAGLNPGYCYAAGTNGTTYHLGAQMEFSVLSNDVNCNSSIAPNASIPASVACNYGSETAWTASNGFDGTQPYIYDLIP